MHVRRSRSTPLLDWPLSHQEKKGCALELYDRDVRAADALLRTNEEKLAALERELESARTGATPASKIKCGVKSLSEESAESIQASSTSYGDDKDARKAAVTSLPCSRLETSQADEAAEKLRAAIAAATAALEALQSRKVTESIDTESQADADMPKNRARSEGPLVGILCKAGDKDPRRRSREPSLARRVSFGKLPADEEEEVPAPEGIVVGEEGDALEPEPETEALFTFAEIEVPPSRWRPTISMLPPVKADECSCESKTVFAPAPRQELLEKAKQAKDVKVSKHDLKEIRVTKPAVKEVKTLEPQKQVAASAKKSKQSCGAVQTPRHRSSERPQASPLASGAVTPRGREVQAAGARRVWRPQRS